jgi:hypothetical protein
MTSGPPSIEGILAKSGLRNLRNETEDAPEGDFFGRKVERISISSLTAQPGKVFLVGTTTAGNPLISGHGDVWVKVVAAEPRNTVVTQNVYAEQAMVFGIMSGSGAVSTQAPSNWPGAMAAWTTADFASSGTQHHIERSSGETLIAPTSGWLEETVREIKLLPVLEQTKNDAEEVVRFCAGMSLDEPLIDVDQHGNIELFFRAGYSGILLIVATTRNLQLFGNENGEKWRAQYELTGRIWIRELPGAMKALAV